ncbi:hypothetical protein HIM_09967 [Hirsutella minnesotensis 3608]|uniref:Uncharacterized protein n=1 Tax=Hirsutella minnesotensis 3608 TaxID=1043627 RepID=A0A0F7ZXF8_9HYPO|nr:hypothetical protein HIM_09967 [Hirsutella minnesotensis 3608]
MPQLRSEIYQERAYVGASRRADRDINARVQSARLASELHKKRTGRHLRITEGIVRRGELYEEVTANQVDSSLFKAEPKERKPDMERQNDINKLFAQAFPQANLQAQQLLCSLDRQAERFQTISESAEASMANIMPHFDTFESVFETELAITNFDLLASAPDNHDLNVLPPPSDPLVAPLPDNTVFARSIERVSQNDGGFADMLQWQPDDCNRDIIPRDVSNAMDRQPDTLIPEASILTIDRPKLEEQQLGTTYGKGQDRRDSVHTCFASQTSERKRDEEGQSENGLLVNFNKSEIQCYTPSYYSACSSEVTMSGCLMHASEAFGSLQILKTLKELRDLGDRLQGTVSEQLRTLRDNLDA